MDWKAIASLIAPFAPTAGRFIGGLIPFPGASIVGGLLGDALAAALGVPNTPEAVGRAVENMPVEELKARLEAVEAEAVARYNAMAEIAKAEAGDRTAQSQAINETQRAEIASGVSWWHWRHLVGYMVMLWFLIPIPAFIRLTFAYDAGAVKQLTDLISACVPLYGFMCGLLGYIAQDSTKLKTTAITGEQPTSVTDTVKNAVNVAVGKAVTPAAPAVVPKPRPIKPGRGETVSGL